MVCSSQIWTLLHHFMPLVIRLCIYILFSLLATLCNHGDVRVVGGYTDYEGRVEVCINGYWGHICYYGWGTTAAMIVCKQLFGENTSKSTVLIVNSSCLSIKVSSPFSFSWCIQLQYWDDHSVQCCCPFLSVFLFPHSVAVVPSSYFSGGTGRIMLYSITCSGSPSRLVDCSYSLVQGYNSGSCYLYHDAGIKCYGVFIP